MKNFEDSIERLIEEGSSPFNFSKLNTIDYEHLMVLSKKISNTNPGFKYCTDYGVVPDKKTDRGIFRRERDDLTGQDAKWLYQYRPSLKRELQNKLLDPETFTPELNDWLKKAKQVYTALHEFSKEIVKGVDHLLPEFKIYERYTDVESNDLHMLRSIAYDESTDIAPVADIHCDYSFITLAPYQSYPGLQLKKRNGNMVEYKPKEGEIMVFWGRKAPTVSNGKLIKVEHMVNVPETGIQRDATVFFGHLWAKMS